MQYRFHEFTLDLDNFALQRNGVAVHVEPLVFDLLRVFVANAGRVLTRDDIIAVVWKGRFVSDTTVSSAIKAARKALGDSGEKQAFIRTVRGRGFQFVAKTLEAAAPTARVVGRPQQAPVDRTTAPSRAGPALQSPPRIAVLPLFPLPRDDELRLLGDAISQELILELARLHWLFVIARGSSFQFRGQEQDLAQAASILGADYFVTGTIVRAGRDCIISIELCQPGSGNIVWADSITISMEGLMHMRSKLAAQIVGALEPRIQLNETAIAARVPTEQLDAWAAYHRGLWHMYRFNARDNAVAAGLFARAVALDPAFARAHAGLSFTHFQSALIGYVPDVEAEREKARRHANLGMELDPLDPFVNLTMGRADWIAGRLQPALSWMERSIALSPNYAFAIYNSALVGTLLGDGETNETRVAKAIALSPIDPLSYAMLATRALTFTVRGDFITAAEWSNRAAQSPNAHIQIFVIAAFSSELAGLRAQAEAHIAHVKAFNPGFTSSDFLKSFPLAPGAVRSQVERSLLRLGLARD
ncbi:MAG: winged helix-turn-helix domain-containing tetratricopeptide repeat protein [Hyphomicrobiaceae bacterium]